MREKNQGNGKSNRKCSVDEFYDEITINCFALLGMTNLLEIERMTLYEYDLRLRAWERERAYRDYDLHLQAFLNALAQSTKTVGKKSVARYKTFKEFFDLEKRLGKKEENPQLKRFREIVMKKKKST